MTAISITWTELSPAGLREEAARTADARAARRMLAIAMVLDGHSRETAAETCAMDRQTLCGWVHRYNEAGVAGLADRPHPGPQPRLTEEQEAEVARWVEQGPDLEKDGVIRWRRVDLRDRIKDRFGVSFHKRSIGKLLRRLNFRRISVRPQHPESDPAEQETFKKTSPGWSARRYPGAPKISPLSSGGRTKRASASRAH